MLRAARCTALLLTLALLRAPALEGPSCLDEDGYGTLLLQKGGRQVARQPSALSVQVDPENGICEPVKENETKVPIPELLAHHPGEDGWCLFGVTGEWASKCAVSRRKGDARTFADSMGEYYKSYIPTSNVSKTLRLPDGRSLHNIVDWSYPLDDAYCWILGWYDLDLDRKAAVNNYTYLTEVSKASCRSLEQSVPNYHQLSFGDMVEESEKDTDEIDKLWASQKPVLNLSQAFVDGMKLHAAVNCLLGGGEGGICDIANCALRGCRLGNDRLGYNLRGDCPPV
ncbi:unnamed protein product [Symbiodinium natans]|uniref:Uncharacterized protein n=1 Tax=Symbiodinium natans TaxID=878477 RepID=A0A812MIR6_9DINO|nr:unnamed protein product [Symbiodinium natans]